MAEIFILGLSHRSAPIEIREQLAFDEAQAEQFLNLGCELPHVEELVLLSTCNRVEIYGVSAHSQNACQQILDLLAKFRKIPQQLIEKHLFFFRGDEALEHGYYVVSSLDSMILGEPQILGQVKEAYRVAQQAGSVGKVLNKYFHHSFHVAKRTRSETGISNHPVSMSYAGVVLAKQIYGDLSQRKALVLGAGKMSELALKHLNSSGLGKIYLSNRTQGKAEVLAKMFGGEVVPFDNFSKWLEDADIIITSTNSPKYLIEADQVQQALKKRRGAPLFFIDIAVPRDVDPEVNKVPNAFLYDVDDLGAVVEVNQKEREQEAVLAKKLIEKEMQDFKKVLSSFKVVPTISSLRKKIERICREELEKTFQKLPQLDGEERELIENMTHGIVKKVLHDPMVILKEEGAEQDQVDYSALVRKLFRLDEV